MNDTPSKPNARRDTVLTRRDLLTPNASLFVGTFLNGINPFSIWGVWLTGTGISITHGSSRTSAIVATAGAYLICLLLMSMPT